MNKIQHFNTPTEYNFIIKCQPYNKILRSIYKYYNVDGAVYDNDNILYALPSSKLYNFDDVTLYFHNQHKNGYIYMIFKHKNDFETLISNIQNLEKQETNSISNPLYRFNISKYTWYLVDSYKTKDANSDIFGYDDYISQIEKDILNHINYNKFLKSINETRSINYLLYGPPGTGKTSMIKAIASKLKCAVFIINTGNIVVNNISYILSPNITIQTPCKIKLLLFEDFDRFLETDKIETIMSQILNSLDGFDDCGNTIRFFTANNKENIFKIDALINRMSSTFEFFMPTIDIFRKKLLRLLSYYQDTELDNTKIEKFLQLVVEKNITIRPFINYVIRYLFDEDYLDMMIKHIDELK